jgi:WS/DGAT/MGAT family acyltransferase
MVTKIHHCMIDGASGVDLAQIQFSVSPEPKELAPPQPFRPRPAPKRAELLAEEARRQASMPFEIFSDFRQFVRNTNDLRDEVSTRINAMSRLLGAGMRADETPINGKVGPHRKVDWFSCRLADLKAIRKGLGCSINDVVLTVLTGAIRRYFLARGVNVDDIDFKVSTPVSVRTKEHEGQMGNQVSSWIIRLPIDRADPKTQLEEINEITEELKETNQAIGVQMMNQIQAWTPSVLLSLGAQAMSGPINMICTNVPGPQIPLYFHGAKILAIYPMVPLMEGQGLGVALTSYAGIMNIGFNADPDLLPDLDFFIEGMIESLKDVAQAAGVELGPVSSDPRKLLDH